MLLTVCFIGMIIMFILGTVTFLHRLSMKNDKKTYLKHDKALRVIYTPEEYQKVVENQKWWDAHDKQKLWIESHDGLQLHANLLQLENPGKRFVILAHGYTSKGKDMAQYARYYEENFAAQVLAPDARGHGESQGNYFGMGWLDRLDYLAWLKYLVKTHGEDIQIILHGQSMGAASLMMLLGEDIPKQVKFLVEDCGYTNVYALFKNQLWRKFRLPWFPILPLVSVYTKVKSGFSFKEADCVKQLQKSTLPTIFIHGAADTFIPTAMVHELFEAAIGPKTCVIIPNAGHGEAFTHDVEGAIKREITHYVVEYC